ncbi:hypothetical protein BGY98DRAFT_1182110 [Russula aff. rugulosa BPL654]|nr:hypothetical protein BGY98DRAFT_1182110 [Russula aff. rugulosa BPL654]
MSLGKGDGTTSIGGTNPHMYAEDGETSYLGPNITAEDKEGIFLALTNLIASLYPCSVVFQDLQKFIMVIDHELPILEYLVVRMTRDHDATFVFPETIRAPRLRHLVLDSLVKLCLFMGDSSTFINPNSLLQWISPLSQLETLEITIFPNRKMGTQPSHTPTITHATLPYLRLLNFRGVCAYLEVLIRQIATPRLERLRVMFSEQHSYSIPCLAQFMNTTENKRLRFDSAKFEFSDDGVRLVTYPHEDNKWCSFSISVDCWDFTGDTSHITQIVDALGQVFSAVKHLVLVYVEPHWSPEKHFGYGLDRTEWHKILRPFSNVKNLRVNQGLVEEFSRYLRLDDGVLPPEILPELQGLTYSGNSNPGDAFTSFIDARQNAGRPVSFKLVHRTPNPSP